MIKYPECKKVQLKGSIVPSLSPFRFLARSYVPRYFFFYFVLSLSLSPFLPRIVLSPFFSLIGSSIECKAYACVHPDALESEGMRGCQMVGGKNRSDCLFRAVPKIPPSRLSIPAVLRRMPSGNLDGSVVRFYEDKGGVERAPFRISP